MTVEVANIVLNARDDMTGVEIRTKRDVDSNEWISRVR
jgi:hypothetical protein